MLVRRKFVGAFAATAVAVGSIGAPAAIAQPQNGLVNVAVGDVAILNNVDIGVAAQVAAQICGVKVGPVAVLGAAADRSGDTRTVCESDQGPVTITG
jgi:hypothetical protein